MDVDARYIELTNPNTGDTLYFDVAQIQGWGYSKLQKCTHVVFPGGTMWPCTQTCEEILKAKEDWRKLMKGKDNGRKTVKKRRKD